MRAALMNVIEVKSKASGQITRRPVEAGPEHLTHPTTGGTLASRCLFLPGTVVHLGFAPNYAKRPDSSGLGEHCRGQFR